VLKLDRLNENMEKEFAHEVYIMRLVTKSVTEFQNGKEDACQWPCGGEGV
jgi:hypothetical protein